jgi:hypothetical protein
MREAKRGAFCTLLARSLDRVRRSMAGNVKRCTNADQIGLPLPWRWNRRTRLALVAALAIVTSKTSNPRRTSDTCIVVL